MTIDARLDLHGLTQDRAKIALEQFIISSYVSGRRYLLVITGKGAPESEHQRHLDTGDRGLSPRGILKQRVPEWLRGAALDSLVLNVSPAQPKDGGSGALYVYLRKNANRQN